jgi:hypothetical protein
VAADRLRAGIDWDAHDDAMTRLIAESDAAAHHLHLLLMQQEAASTVGTGPAVSHGSGDTTT